VHTVRSQSNEIVYIEDGSASEQMRYRKSETFAVKNLDWRFGLREVHLRAFGVVVGDLQREPLAACCVAWRSIEKRNMGASLACTVLPLTLVDTKPNPKQRRW